MYHTYILHWSSIRLYTMQVKYIPFLDQLNLELQLKTGITADKNHLMINKDSKVHNKYLAQYI